MYQSELKEKEAKLQKEISAEQKNIQKKRVKKKEATEEIVKEEMIDQLGKLWGNIEYEGDEKGDTEGTNPFLNPEEEDLSLSSASENSGSFFPLENHQMPESEGATDTFGTTTTKDREKVADRFPEMEKKTPRKEATEILLRIMKYKSEKGKRNTLRKEMSALSPIKDAEVLQELMKILPTSLQDDFFEFRRE